MPGDQLPPRPDARDRVEPDDGSIRLVVWLTIGVNAMLALLTLAGWIGRPTSCSGGCSWRPMGGMLWVLLAIVDVGLVLIWAGIGYLYLVGVGERIGRRLSDRRDGRQD
jgi:Ni,Fe-hydrogenase I cytochrome b subunit